MVFTTMKVEDKGCEENMALVSSRDGLQLPYLTHAARGAVGLEAVNTALLVLLRGLPSSNEVSRGVLEMKTLRPIGHHSVGR